MAQTPAIRVFLAEGEDPLTACEAAGPGAYCGPITGYTGAAPGVTAEEYAADSSLGLPSVFFLLPIARDPEVPYPGARSLHHVASPPHVFRECADGSLDIRESIGCRGPDGDFYWHGYLNEGNVWRTV